MDKIYLFYRIYYDDDNNIIKDLKLLMHAIVKRLSSFEKCVSLGNFFNGLR